MNINGLELFHISIPFVHPYRLSKVYGTLKNAQAVIAKLHTEAGIVGLGEADPMDPFTEETPGSVMAVMREFMAPHLLDEDPSRIARIEQRLDDVLHGNLSARGAINMALFDIIGKLHHFPVHTFLGVCCTNGCPCWVPSEAALRRKTPTPSKP
jgi:L-alanine-DL-glutamate epimerase-like enolase superfamily enzyme